MDLSLIPIGNGSRYTKDQMAEAITWMALKGSVTEVEKITGIPKQTLHNWTLSEWWPQALRSAQSDLDAEVDAMTTGIVRKAAQESADRLESGDVIPIKLKKTTETPQGRVTEERVELVRKRVSGVDATKIGTFWFNTQRVLRNLPTSVPGGGSDSRLTAMAERLKEIERRQDAAVVSEQGGREGTAGDLKPGQIFETEIATK